MSSFLSFSILPGVTLAFTWAYSEIMDVQMNSREFCPLGVSECRERAVSAVSGSCLCHIALQHKLKEIRNYEIFLHYFHDSSYSNSHNCNAKNQILIPQCENSHYVLFKWNICIPCLYFREIYMILDLIPHISFLILYHYLYSITINYYLSFITSSFFFYITTRTRGNKDN